MLDKLQTVRSPLFNGIAKDDLSTMLHCIGYHFTSYQKGEIVAFTGLAAVYLCGAEMAGSLYPWLYLAGALFCLTDSHT